MIYWNQLKLGGVQMKKLVLNSSDKVRQEILGEISNLNNGHYIHRLDALLLIAYGRDAYEVAVMYGHSPRSIHDWIKGVNQHGLDYLLDDQKPGRPTKLSQEQLDQLRGDILHTPSELGYDQNSWNGKLLSEHIRDKYGVELKTRRCQALFHELGFSYKRPRKMAFGSSQEAKDDFKKNETTDL
jgi:transposase